MGAALPPVNLQYTAVPAATGNSLTDTANINAAIAAAGNGGIVSFPSNQTYIIRNYAGSTAVIPRLMIGNGSTLKTDNAVYTTIASGSVTTNTTTIVVVNSSLFNVGDSLSLTDGAGNFSNPTVITANNTATNTLTVVAITMSQGTTINSGATVLRNDLCIYFKWPAATSNLHLEVTGFILDGNQANRVGQQWANQQLTELQGAAGYTSAIWFHHNVFQNGPCDGLAVNDVSYIKIQDNHFQNIMGNGTHPGGSGNTFDVIVSGNTFYNVSQYNASTTPTVTVYGHVLGYGAMVTSDSPHRLVIADNVVDTAQGCGFDGINSNNDDTYAVTGNVFYNCTMGGFHVTGGKWGTISGNIINSCGHDIAYVTGDKEITCVNSSGTRVAITGNTFIESPLTIAGDSSEITITGNSFTNLANQYGTSNIYAALFITYSSVGSSKINVTGNEFRGPMNTAELTAVSGAPLNGIQVYNGANINISENVITGYRFGIYTAGSIGFKNVKISGNVLQDQIASSGTSAHGIYLTSAILQGFKVCNNSISRLNDTSWYWMGIEQAVQTTTVNNASITGNQITTLVTPAITVGMEFDSFTMAGFKIADNEFWLNPGSGCSAIAGGSMTSACWAVNNIVHNGSTVNYGSATTTAGNQAF